MVSANDPAQSGFVQVHESGARVKYWRYGHGADVLLVLHGGPSYDHRHLLPLVELASDRCQVVFFDQLGGGESDSPDSPELWTIERFADEVEILRSTLELGRVSVYGHSWGGFLALQYALMYPESIRSLILSNTAASTTQILQGWERIRSTWPVDVYAAARRMEAHGLWNDPAYEKLLLRWFLTPHLRRNHPYDSDTAISEILPLLQLLQVRGTARDRLMGDRPMDVTGTMIDWDVSDRLAELHMPTLVLTGVFDGISSDCALTLAKGLPESHLQIFERSSHMMMHEHESQAYLATIRTFLRTPHRGAIASNVSGR